MDSEEKKPLTIEEKRDKWLKDDFAEVLSGIQPLEANAVQPKRMSVNPAMYRDTSFKPGQSGNPAGTRKGAQLKKTVRQIVEEMRFNPIEAAVMIITEDKRIKKKFKIVDPVPVKDKMTMIKWIGDKIYPSLKAVEVTNIDGDPAEAGRPKTVQLYLPEKGSTDNKPKKTKHIQPVYDDDDDEPVRLELTPEVAKALVQPVDAESSDGRPEYQIDAPEVSSESNKTE